ncbi:MAG: hypothetical protein J7J38_00475 [Candidatus Aenigmarchaeota archaeon]|nr:hypothetical protein [Candidatus Aenigmarchaeota archaeon]
MDFSLIIASVSSFFACVGLLLNRWAVRENNKTRQLQLFENTFNNIKETERLLYDKYKKLDPDAKKEWDSLFFNTLEFFAFLVNENHLNKKLSKFFNDAIIDWYERIFMKYHNKDISNPKIYPELKKLYKLIKATKNPQN